MVDTIMREFIAVLLKIIEEEGEDGDKVMRDGVEKSKHGRATGKIRVPDMFWKTGDGKFLDRVLNMDTVRDGVGDKRVVGATGGDKD